MMLYMTEVKPRKIADYRKSGELEETSSLRDKIASYLTGTGGAKTGVQVRKGKIFAWDDRMLVSGYSQC